MWKNHPLQILLLIFISVRKHRDVQVLFYLQGCATYFDDGVSGWVKGEDFPFDGSASVFLERAGR
jgi:hypothetical protein